MRLHKLLRISSIALFCLTISIALFSILQSPPSPAAQKPMTVAFNGLQKRSNEVRNSLFTVNANGAARRELTPKIDVSSTLVWSPNGQRLAFVSGDTDVYTINARHLGDRHTPENWKLAEAKAQLDEIKNSV